MKKFMTIALIAIMALSALALVGCGGSSDSDLSDSKYVGTWAVDDMSFADETETLDTEWTLTINGDGTGISESEGEVSEFTWEPTNNGFKTKGDVELKFKDDGDNITTKVIGVTLTFIKQ